MSDSDDEDEVCYNCMRNVCDCDEDDICDCKDPCQCISNEIDSKPEELEAHKGHYIKKKDGELKMIHKVIRLLCNSIMRKRVYKLLDTYAGWRLSDKCNTCGRIIYYIYI